MQTWELRDGTRFEAQPVPSGTACEICEDAAAEGIACTFQKDGETHQWSGVYCDPCAALLTIPGRPDADA